MFSMLDATTPSVAKKAACRSRGITCVLIGSRFKAQLFANTSFHGRVDIGEGPHRTADCAGCDLGPRGLKPGPVAIHFGVESGEGQPHRRRFGVNSVAATDTDRLLVFKRAPFQGFQKPVHIGQQDVRGAGQLNIERGVQNVLTLVMP